MTLLLNENDLFNINDIEEIIAEGRKKKLFLKFKKMEYSQNL